MEDEEEIKINFLYPKEDNSEKVIKIIIKYIVDNVNIIADAEDKSCKIN